MRTTYLQDKKSPRKAPWVILVFACTFFIGYFFVAPVGNFVNQTFSMASFPFLRAGNWISEKFNFSAMYLWSKNSVIEDNRLLQNEIDILNFKMNETVALKEENLALKKLMGRIATGTDALLEDVFSSRHVLAGVISGPEIPPYDSLILDAGKNQGVLVGQTVFAGPDIAVGKIFYAGAEQSKVRLFSSYGIKTSVFVGKNMLDIFGIGGGKFAVQVPKDFLVEVGDIAVMPGVTMTPVSIVKRIDDDPKGGFKWIFFEAPINGRELRFVAISK